MHGESVPCGLTNLLEKDAHLTAKGYEWSLRGGVHSARRVELGQTTLPDLCIMSPLNRTVATSLSAQQALMSDNHPLPCNLALSQAREVANSVGSSIQKKEFDCIWESGQSDKDDDFEWDRIGRKNYETGQSHNITWSEPLDERPGELWDTIKLLARGINRRTGRGRS